MTHPAWADDPAFGTDGEDVDEAIAEAMPGDNTTSDLAAIAKLAAERLDAPLRLKVAAMPGFVAAYRTSIDTDELDSIYKRSRRRGAGGKVTIDQIKVNRLILAETCVGLWRDGKQVVNPQGDPSHFRDKALNAEFGFHEADTVALVGAFFHGRDGEISAHADAVLRAAGFGGEVEEDDDAPDPTTAG